jgi:hypothetical protein
MEEHLHVCTECEKEFVCDDNCGLVLEGEICDEMCDTCLGRNEE